MVCKCPHCDGALEYNPKLGKMKCPYCGSHILIKDVQPIEFKVHKDENSEVHINDGETMACKIYTCTSCAGELAINDVEVSTFCPYCGQPTIVFSRVSQELKPRYIVPFKITREQAENSIRKKVKESNFAPDEVRNFEIDRLCGIYIPYWLFDIYYYDNIKFDGYTGAKHKSHWVYTREAECTYNGITLDASKNLNDEFSRRLEPYNLTEVVPFESAYLSGFYTDKFDVPEEKLVGAAVHRANDFFVEEIKNSVEGTVTGIRERHPRYRVTRTEYALLPAWFLTFRYKNEPYTLIVNGQTGKIVGSVPVDDKKLKTNFMKIFLITLAVELVLSFFALFTGGGMYLIYIVLSIIFFAIGYTKYSQYKKNLALSKESRTNRYVKERQEKL